MSPPPPPADDEDEDASSAMLLAVLLMIVVCCAACVLGHVRFVRRLNRKQLEVAHREALLLRTQRLADERAKQLGKVGEALADETRANPS